MSMVMSGCCHHLMRPYPNYLHIKFVCLFELILNVTVNSYGHVGTLPPCNATLSKLMMS